MSDKKIWNNLRNGEQSALELIYRTYFKELYQYGRKFTIDQATVEDCIQNLFIELWNRRANLSETNAIKPYLYLSLKRKIIKVSKAVGKMTENEIDDRYFDVQLAMDDILISDEARQINKTRLEAAFKQLSDRQKEILYLKYYSEMDYDQIIEIMNLNYQSARNLVSRALTKLHKIWILVLVLWTINLGEFYGFSSFIK